jgi:hypothetical protein
MAPDRAPSRLLITGVPGTGKTTVAAWLAGNGYRHTDMDGESPRAREELSYDTARFTARLGPGCSVITWGFSPLSEWAAVEKLRAAGYFAVWLDGDRVASFRAFMRRESGSPLRERDYYRQMETVVSTQIAERLGAPVICPFTGDGRFRPVADIAADILRAARMVTAPG